MPVAPIAPDRSRSNNSDAGSSDGADQLLFQDAQHRGEIVAALQDTAIHADDGIDPLATEARTLFDPIERMLGGVPEDGEGADRVISGSHASEPRADFLDIGPEKRDEMPASPAMCRRSIRGRLG